MTERPGPTLAIYNPDLLSDADLSRQFVARLGLLRRLTDDLGLEGSPQHHLIVGQRGMGKTTLLRRLRGAIQEDERLRARWLPLSFPEEQYNVSRLSDLWVNCLDALGDALERGGDDAGAHAVDALVSGLPQDEGARGRAALDGLVRWSVEKRGLVLMIDNVDILLGRLDGQHWALREAMSVYPSLVWIVASAQPLEATADYGSAFYDFFAIHELRGLDYEESRQVVLRLAEVHDTPQVSRLLEEAPGRFRALHVLTGGNPRTLVLLYQVFAHDDASSVHVDLERLLDMCTPLYKARFEALSAQGQQLTDALAIGWDPMTAAQVAAATRLEINLVSAQLNRLVQLGVVEKVPLPAGSRTGFQIGERFFNIWYLMRASRRVRRRLEWLVRFLEMLYGPAGMAEHAQRMLGRGGDGRDAELALAMSRSVSAPGLSRALDDFGMDLLMSRDAGFRAQLRELFDLEGEDREIATLAERKALLAEAHAAVLAAPVDWEAVGCTAETFWELLGGSLLALESKGQLSRELAGRSLSQIRALKTAFKAESERVGKLLGVVAWAGLQKGVRTGLMVDVQDVDGADAAQHRFGCEDLPTVSRMARMDVQGFDSEQARWIEEHIDRCTAPTTWNSWGNLLQDHLSRYEEAEAAYRRAIALDANFALPWNGLGNLLKKHMGRYLEAEDAYRKAIELDSSYASPWNNLGALLQDQLERQEEAEPMYRQALALNPGLAAAWLNLARLLAIQLGRPSEAIEACREAVRLSPENLEFQNYLAWSLFRSGDASASTEELARIAVSGAPEDLYYAHTLACILVAHGNWSEAAIQARRFISEGDDDFHTRIWSDILVFFRECVRAGQASGALVLLDEGGLGERWRPLREALAAVAAGDPDQLLAVAPEVRHPATTLLDQLWPAEERPEPKRHRRR